MNRNPENAPSCDAPSGSALRSIPRPHTGRKARHGASPGTRNPGLAFACTLLILSAAAAVHADVHRNPDGDHSARSAFDPNRDREGAANTVRFMRFPGILSTDSTRLTSTSMIPATSSEPSPPSEKKESDKNQDTPAKRDSSEDSPESEESQDAEESEEAEEPAHILVEGQVIDHIGGGQEGVTVTVHLKNEDGTEGELLGETKTDSLGDFKVGADEAFHGDVIVTFTKETFTTITKEVHVGHDEWPPYLAETLEGNLVLKGSVLDGLTDKPVADATVTLKSFYRDWSATTDAQGNFTIDKISPGRAELIVEAESYGRETQPIERIDGSGEHVIKLKPERIVHLEVRDEDGESVAGAMIELLDEPRQDFRTVITDEKGRVTVDGLHFDAAELALRLTHESYVSSLGFDEHIITPPDSHESTHQITMMQAGTIKGTVVSAATGEPVNGARIVTGTEYSDISPRDWSDYEGKFTIKGVKPGTVTLTLHLSDHAPMLKRVEANAGEVTTVTFEVRPGVDISGVVLSHEGEPVQGAYVEAGEWNGVMTLGLRAMTDHEGKFFIPDAPPEEFALNIHGPTGARLTTTLTPDESATPEFKLPEGPAPGQKPADSPADGSDAPDFTIETLAGQTIALSDLKGKTVLLDFWATWCGPCVVELPKIKEIHETYGDRDDFALIGISLDSDKTALSRFVSTKDLGWPQVVGKTAQDTANKYGVQFIPATFIIGPTGKIEASHLNGDALLDKLNSMLKKQEPS